MLRKVLLCSNKFQCIVHYMPLWKIVHYHPKLLLGKVFSMCVCMCPCVDELKKGIKCEFALYTITSRTLLPLITRPRIQYSFHWKDPFSLLKKKPSKYDWECGVSSDECIGSYNQLSSFTAKISLILISKMAVFISFYLLCHHWIVHCVSRLDTSVV